MANQKHLNVLWQGVEAWNAWQRAQPSSTFIDLSGADLSETDLSGVYIGIADLSSVNLVGAGLSNAYLSGADLRQANLRDAKLIGADLSSINLVGADLSGADLSGAKLSGTYLNRADFRNADLHNATLGWTIFANVDLRHVKGLETIRHRGPSTIGTDTLLRSQGEIPEVFLRGAGHDDTFISYVRSLVNHPIQYYTCFISYSSKDQDFAVRLHADLQQKGVRCWFAPEDLKIGDKFRMRIDEAIRLYDKLLLVLSLHSVKSPWVEKEVEAAFEKEHRQNRLVLFPIKLDDTVMHAEEAWATDIRRIRHIGDFRYWKDHDRYQQAFQRLLRDLKAEAVTE